VWETSTTSTGAPGIVPAETFADGPKTMNSGAIRKVSPIEAAILVILEEMSSEILSFTNTDSP
jgi:hypothetical protein